MKRFTLHVSCCLLTLLSLSAQADLTIFSCEPEWAALSQQLAGDKAAIFTATTGLQDPHHIQARPSLIAQIKKADLVVCTGADLEAGWLPLLLRRAANAQIQPGQPGYFMASTQVKLLGAPKQLDRSQGDVHAAGNPHIQTNPENILRVAKSLSARMMKLDPANQADYQLRLDQFVTEWQQALQRWRQQVIPLRGQSIVVYHASWDYLEDFAQLKQLASIEDKPGIPPTSGHLANLLSQLRVQPAMVIIYAAYQDGGPAQWLSQRTGIPALKLPFTVGGDDQAVDLITLYDSTFDALLKAFHHE